MRRFILKLFLFFGGVLVVDIMVGASFNWMKNSGKGGLYRDNYICNEMRCEVLILGSSRCLGHYNPLIIEDSMHMSCYNAGQAGNGIMVAYATYQMVSEREKPQIVIYDINPDFDLLDKFDNHRYLSWLKFFYEKEYVKSIIYSIDKREKYKMMSSMYRYNSLFLQILIDLFDLKPNNDIKGFVPCDREMDKTKINKNEMNINSSSYSFDPLKISYINKLIDTVGKERMIIAISPRWYGLNRLSMEPVLNICAEKGVKIVDFSNSPKYVHNDIYFRDGVHLNAKGADEFTKDLIKYIKRQ